MSTESILSKVVLRYEPLIDRLRKVTTTRLSVAVLEPDGPLLNAAHLLDELSREWPDFARHVLLNVQGDALLRSLLRAKPPVALAVEVPGRVACEPEQDAALIDLARAGNAVFLNGRLQPNPPPGLMPSFKRGIIDLAQDRRTTGPDSNGGHVRSIAFVHSGIQSMSQMAESFGRGSVSVLGWPTDDLATSATIEFEGDVQIIVELIRLVDEGAEPERIGIVLKRDPVLSFSLLRQMNSAGSGLRREVESFEHAIMLLGYQPLKRWLALLLLRSFRDPIGRLVSYSSLRRGLLIEQVIREQGGTPAAASDGFVCGAFSWLDRVMKRPFPQLLGDIAVSPAVRAALVSGEGPLAQCLANAQAVERGTTSEILNCSGSLDIGLEASNRVLIRSLGLATEIERL